MAETLLQTTILILDKQYSPVEIRSVQDSLRLVYVGKALVMTPDYSLHELEEWIDYSAKRIAEDPTTPYVIKSPSISLVIPEVIVLKDYIKNAARFRSPRCNRHSLLKRDAHTCQYCYRKLPRKQLEIDHVIPQSKGGKTTWSNCVSSCKPCNSNKGDLSVEQAGYKLLKVPVQPTWKQLFDRSDKKKLWEIFLK